MKETIDVLTGRAKSHLKDAADYQAKADKSILAAGTALRELKARVTNKEAAEGKKWGHSWHKFVQTKLKGECSYSHAQRLIAFAESKNPVAAIAEYRKQDAAQKRDRRASQTSENAAKQRPKGSPPQPAITASEVKQQLAESVVEPPERTADSIPSPDQAFEASPRLRMLKRMWDASNYDEKRAFMAHAGLIYEVPEAA